ncbi:MAG: biotin--[acetyl-CoA-carboxylase] ligase [Bacteroidia bacterium]|nr:biotin--[acetyl-CoA-carboxylase] ligase [Bacteroidia bacterium]
MKLDKVDSTNRYLRSLLAKDSPPEGLVVWALEQYEGRGQRGSKWLSQPGANLTLSMLLRPAPIDARSQFWLTKAIALGVAECVSRSLRLSAMGDLAEGVKIKWPNDVFVNDRKIAGILIENILEGERIKYSVAGIGVNINQVNFDPSLPGPASLKLLTGKEFELSACVESLCMAVEKYYLELRKTGYGRIDELYHKLLYRKDEWNRFLLDGKEFRGRICQVNAEGHLMLQAPELKDRLNRQDLLEIKDIKQLQFI